MSQPCSYCSGPVRDPHAGRPVPSGEAATYCCYGCLSLGERDRTESDHLSRRKSFHLGVRLAVGLFVIAQSMIFGLAVSLEDDTPRPVKLAVQGGILAGTVLVLVLLGSPLFRSAGRELRRRKITLEAMFVLTLVGAMVASVQSLVTGTGPVYFEVVSVLVVIYTLGKELTARTRAAAWDSSRLWLSAIESSRRLLGDREEEVPTSRLRPGDAFVVRPGETFPLDGVVLRGEGLVSEASINGEPMPKRKVPGDTVHAGAASYDARFEVRATSECGTRRIDALSLALEEAQLRPTNSQAFADRLGGALFPLTLSIALITFAVWTYTSDWRTGLFHSMSVLLVACPCAIGLATPLVIWTTLSRLAERGLVLNSGEAIEKLAKIDFAFFDKTGTLSEESLSVHRLHWLSERVDREEMLSLLKRIEAESDHPVAKAFRDRPGDEVECRIDSLTVVPGVGIEGEVSQAGTTRRFRVGRLDWIDTLGPRSDDRRVGFELDGGPVLVVELAERVRPSVDSALRDLRSVGISLGMLTGDPVGREVASRFDVVREGVLPDEKAATIREAQASGTRVLMVGDGVNDAAALAQADVGIALASGTDLANGVASGTLYHGDLRVLPWAVAMSRESVRRIRASLYRSLAYNAVGVTLAACGVLHPVVAVLLMIVSSLLVMWSSTRVGVEPAIDCRDASDAPNEHRESASWVAVAHGLFFALQGLLVAELVGRDFLPLLVASALVGVLLARVWYRWRLQPHWFDMTVGMLTLGNFGMLLGWLADNRFRPLQAGDCCACVEVVRGNFSTPWMWLGMLAFANVAMCFPRRRDHAGHSRVAMFTGGNLGMILGMVAGGWLAGRFDVPGVAGAFALGYVGMTLGMVVGMIFMSELTQRALTTIIALRHFPRWLLRTESVPTLGERDAERVDAPVP
jgi:heavy metal translocating P-type ATPase